MYAGCVSGAIPIDEYLDILQRVGFENVAVQRENKINIPEKVLQEFLTSEQIDSFDKGESGIYSISIYGEKPEECCDPECCN